MPELPEVDALVGFLRERAVGAVVAAVEVASVAVLKTFDPPPSALAGGTVTGVERHGKWIDLDVDGLHLVVHLARAGWLRWSEALPAAPPKPGRGSVALRVRLDDAGTGDDAGRGARAGAVPGRLPGFDLTEAGTRKGMAVHVMRDPSSIPAIATLGPDPLDPGFDVAALADVLAGRRSQVKGVLRDQGVVAGIGNAWSDEILHAAKISPFTVAATLDGDTVARLHASVKDVLGRAVAASAGRPAAELKDAKRSGMAVHGRTGEACPVCGDVVREVVFADRSLQYCATCQTDGKPLADRRLSRLVR